MVLFFVTHRCQDRRAVPSFLLILLLDLLGVLYQLALPLSSLAFGYTSPHLPQISGAPGRRTIFLLPLYS